MVRPTEPVSTASSSLPGGASAAPPVPNPSTLNQLFATAMRHHDRRAVLKWHDGTNWQTAPDWQLDRQVIRVGLYLHHRVALRPGDRVALVAGLRPEWLAADLAIQGLGAVSVTADPGLTEAELQAALAEASPRVAFVSTPAWDKIRAFRPALPELEQVVVFDGPLAGEDAALYATVLDYAGTLDTPERAQAFRATARQVTPGEVTGRHYETEEVRAGLVGYQTLAQGDVLDRIQATWSASPPEPGDVAYVAGPEVTLATRLALYAMAGDGQTTTVIGRPGREAEELAAIQPQTVILPAAVVRACLDGPGPEAGDETGAGLATRLRARLAAWTAAGKAEQARMALRRRLGGRARRVGGARPLDADLRQRLVGLGEVVG